MQEIRSLNPPKVTGICDPGNSQARRHCRKYLKITSELHYDLAFSLRIFIYFPNSKPKVSKETSKKACISQFGQIKLSESDFQP